MTDVKNLKELVRECLYTATTSHVKLEMLSGILRLVKRSSDPKLHELAQDCEEEVADFVKSVCTKLYESLNSMLPYSPEQSGPTGILGKASNLELMDMLVTWATELDKTGDQELIKEASVIDEILLTLAAPRDAKEAFKLAEDKEIERLREKYRTEALEDSYKHPREELQKDLKTADAVKAIENSVKEYRPMEAPLSTRTCPDHPGAQMQRIGDTIYQCSLDKKVYNYRGGFTTMKGNKVPGGDVSEQTHSLGDRAFEHMSFDTRESKLNP